ncbi:hypothetical protein ACET3Z_001368 [Daucus carota]
MSFHIVITEDFGSRSSDANFTLNGTRHDTFSKYEEEKEKLFIRYEQQRKRRKKEKSLIPEQEKACANRIAELEESLKKKKQIRDICQIWFRPSMFGC